MDHRISSFPRRGLPRPFFLVDSPCLLRLGRSTLPTPSRAPGESREIKLGLPGMGHEGSTDLSSGPQGLWRRVPTPKGADVPLAVLDLPDSDPIEKVHAWGRIQALVYR